MLSSEDDLLGASSLWVDNLVVDTSVLSFDVSPVHAHVNSEELLFVGANHLTVLLLPSGASLECVLVGSGDTLVLLLRLVPLNFSSDANSVNNLVSVDFWDSGDESWGLTGNNLLDWFFDNSGGSLDFLGAPENTIDVSEVIFFVVFRRVLVSPLPLLSFSAWVAVCPTSLDHPFSASYDLWSSHMVWLDGDLEMIWSDSDRSFSNEAHPSDLLSTADLDTTSNADLHLTMAMSMDNLTSLKTAAYDWTSDGNLGLDVNSSWSRSATSLDVNVSVHPIVSVDVLSSWNPAASHVSLSSKFSTGSYSNRDLRSEVGPNGNGSV